jgi:ABC-2 type transport system permease protein
LSNGGFDRVLVRPRNEIFQVLASQVDFSRLGRFDKVLTLVLMVICGSLVFAGLFIVYAAISFFTVEGLEFMNVLTDGGCIFGRYPYSIYGRGVLRFLTFVVPLALFQYYPYMFAPLLSLLFLIPCFALYRFGLKCYKSTGS